MTGSLEQQKAKGAVEYTYIYYTDIHISETTTVGFVFNYFMNIFERVQRKCTRKSYNTFTIC